MRELHGGKSLGHAGVDLSRLEARPLPQGQRHVLRHREPAEERAALEEISEALAHSLKGLAPLCVPVNVVGSSQSRDLAAKIDEAFMSENQMLMFPGKLCSRRINGKVQDLPWGKAFIRKSVMTGRQVVPVHFIAENSRRFYRIANWCKRLGLKFNLAMLYLPDELYKAQHSTFKVVFGDPIPPETFDKSRSAYDWAQWVRAKVYEL